MSELFRVYLRIGGPFHRALLPQLYELVAAEDLESLLEEKPTQEDFLYPERLTNDDGFLEFVTESANWGTLPDLEKFLRDRGVGYDKQIDTKYEYDATLVQSRPGSAPVRQLTDVNGDPVVHKEDLEPIVLDLQADRPQEALEKLQNLIGLPVPDLTPFTLIG